MKSIKGIRVDRGDKTLLLPKDKKEDSLPSWKSDERVSLRFAVKSIIKRLFKREKSKFGKKSIRFSKKIDAAEPEMKGFRENFPKNLTLVIF